MNSMLCIDIGASTIKLIYGSKWFGRIRIKKHQILKTPSASFSNGYIQDFDQLSEAISKFTKDNRLKNTKASFVVQSSDMVIRSIQHPTMDRGKIKASVEWDFSQIVNKPVHEEYYLEHWTKRSNAKQLSVVYVAVPKRLIDQYETLTKLAGLRLRSIEGASVCLARLAGRENLNQIIVDFGHESVRITFCNGKMVLADRVLVFQPSLQNCVYSDHIEAAEREKALDAIFKNLSSIEDFFQATHGREKEVLAIGGMAKSDGIQSKLMSFGRQTNSLTQQSFKLSAEREFLEKLDLFAGTLGLLNGSAL